MRLWRMLIVAYVFAKFGDDRLWNEKALADRKIWQAGRRHGSLASMSVQMS